MPTPSTGRFPSLSSVQIKLLDKNDVSSPADLLLTPASDLARKLRLSPQQAQEIVAAVARDTSPSIFSLADVGRDENEALGWRGGSFGDERMDRMVGGLRPGQVYDLCGESGSGKTQLALQLALLVQLPAPHGLSGSAAYITTSSALPTQRLVQILSSHPTLSSPSIPLHDAPSLTNVHISRCASPEQLVHLLSTVLPSLISQLSSTARPLRLLVLDSLAALFRSTGTSSSTLFSRSKLLTHIGSLARALARDSHLAVVVLNQVSGVFERAPSSSSSSTNLSQTEGVVVGYREQARWFGSAPHSMAQEASLGLVWANEVNVRLMLSRTGRTYYFPAEPDVDEGRPAKRRRVELGASAAEGVAGKRTPSTGVRRMDVIFHPSRPSACTSFIITAAGLVSIADDRPALSSSSPHAAAQSGPAGAYDISAEELVLYAQAMEEAEAEGDDEWVGSQARNEEGGDEGRGAEGGQAQ